MGAHELTTNQKINYFEMSSVIIHIKNKQFLDWIGHAMKSGVYMTASSEVGPRSLKALPKAKLAPKRGHGHCLVICFPSDPLQLSESWINHYIWEVCTSIRCTENCKACNQHWSTERAHLGNHGKCTEKGPQGCATGRAYLWFWNQSCSLPILD